VATGSRLRLRVAPSPRPRTGHRRPPVFGSASGLPLRLLLGPAIAAGL